MPRTEAARRWPMGWAYRPGLPLKKGRAATMTHDYKRHGITTLFAALDVKSDLGIGECMPRHALSCISRLPARPG